MSPSASTARKTAKKTAGSPSVTQKNANLKLAAYEAIKQDLVTCKCPPGSILNEAQIANDLGFSRTPVREAISILETEGFLQVLPKKGIFVTDILLSDVSQIFQTRMEIEPICVRLAAASLNMDELLRFRDLFMSESAADMLEGVGSDAKMHLYIIDHCGNDYIIDMMHKVFDKNMRVVVSSKHNQAHLAEAKEQHVRILDSLIRQETEQAAELMRIHVSACRRAAFDQFY